MNMGVCVCALLWDSRPQNQKSKKGSGSNRFGTAFSIAAAQILWLYLLCRSLVSHVTKRTAIKNTAKKWWWRVLHHRPNIGENTIFGTYFYLMST